MNKITIRGKFNEILTENIGEGTTISGWTFVGRNVKIGKNCRISNFVNIDYGCIIGDNTNIQPYCLFNNNTIVGSDCLFGAGLITVDEKYLTPFTDTIIRTPCKIGSNVMIGAGVRLVCAEIGDNSVIGTGSVVLKDIPPNEVWVGHPAKFLMSRKEFDEKQKSHLKK